MCKWLNQYTKGFHICHIKASILLNFSFHKIIDFSLHWFSPREREKETHEYENEDVCIQKHFLSHHKLELIFLLASLHAKWQRQHLQAPDVLHLLLFSCVQHTFVDLAQFTSSHIRNIWGKQLIISHLQWNVPLVCAGMIRMNEWNGRIIYGESFS